MYSYLRTQTLSLLGLDKESKAINDGQVCDECAQLFLNPEHIETLFSGFSIANLSDHTLSYRRNIHLLEANAQKGCRLCIKLAGYFRLNTDLWDGFKHGLSAENTDDVAFAVYLVDIAPLVLIIRLESALEGESNCLSFELLTASGRYYCNLSVIASLHRAQGS